jgi:hypothetical protein
MYIDYCLKFDSEAEARAVLYRIEGAVEADPENGVEAQEGYEVANYDAIDMIGVICKPTGQIINTTEGDVPEMAPVDGYHANVRVLKEAQELEAYRVHPVTPERVWF